MNSMGLILLLLLGMAAVHDLVWRRIPNRLVLCGLACAALWHLMSAQPWTASALGLAGAALGLLLLLPLYAQRAMAAGDVKLLAMVGAFVGPAALLEIILFTVVIGALMGCAIALRHGRLGEMLGNCRRLARLLLLRALGVPLQGELASAASVGSMPYGVAIALGTLAALWLGQH